MNKRILNLYRLIGQYFFYIAISGLLLFFLIREFETATDVTFNQGEVVFTVSDLLNNVNEAHLNLQYFRDYHKSEYWTNFNSHINKAHEELDLILNGWEKDGKEILPVRFGKIRTDLSKTKNLIDEIILQTRKFRLNENPDAFDKRINDIHLKFTNVSSLINNAKAFIYNHFNITRKNFYKYKVLSIIFSTVLLFVLGFVLVAKDRQKAKNLKLLNIANINLNNKIKELTETSRKLQTEININKTILKTTLNGFLLTDTNGTIVDVNPAYSQMTGYSLNEIKNMNIRDLEAQIPQDKIKELIEEILTKRKARFETKHKCKNGSLIDLDVSVSLLEIDGETFIAAFLNDITERKKIVAKLEKDEKRYRIILNNIDEIVYQIDCVNPGKLFNGKVVFISPKTEKIMGIKQEEFYKDPRVWFENVHPDDVENVKKSTQEIVSKKGSGQRDYRIKNIKTGEYRWIEDRITTLVDSENNFLGIVGVARDITEWVIAKKRLEENELRYRTLFDLAPNGIMLEDRNGNIIDANKTLYENFGYEKGELIGKNVKIFTHPENLESFDRNIEKIMNGETLRHTLKSIKKDGSEIYVRLSETKIHLPNLEEGILSISEDITELVRMQDALKKSEEKYKKLIEISPIGVTILKEGKIVYANPALAETLGFKNTNELLGKSIIDFVHPKYLQFAQRRLRNLTDKKQSKVNLAEEKFIKKTGEEIDVLVVGQQIEFEGEDAVQGYIYDITEQKMLNLELQKSKEQLKEAQHIARLGNWQWDLQTNEIEWSDEIFNIFEIQPNEIEKSYETFKNMVYEEDKKYVEKKINSAIRLKKTFDIIHRIYLKNGKIKYVQARGKVYYDTDDNPLRVVGTLQDITELKQTELALQESERRISGIMKAAPIGIGLVKNRVLDYVNDYLCNFLGYTKSEMEGKPTELFYPNKDEYQKIGELYQIAAQKGVASDEAVIQCKSGKLVNVIISLCPLDKNDLSQGSIFSVLDITERKQIENHLKFEEARYRGLFEHAPISIWEEDFHEGKKYIDELKQKGIKDFNKYFTENPDELKKMIGLVKIININNETVRMLKVKSKRQILQGLEQMFIPESIETFKDEISLLAEGKTKFAQESKQRDFTGNIQDIFVTVSIAPGFEKDWKRVFVTILDITEQKRYTETIKASEANLRSLIERRQEAIWSIDKNYNFIIFNNYAKQKYKQIYGIIPRKGKNTLDGLTDELKRLWKPKYDEALKGNRIHFEFNEKFDGQIHYFDVYLTPIVTDNRVTGVSVIAINIDDKIKQESQLRYQAKLLDSAQDAIIASKDYEMDTDLNHTITYWNKGAERLYGWKKEEVLGKRILDVLKSQPVNTTFAQIGKEISERGEWVGEIIQHNRKGERIISLTSINAVYENGKIVGTFGVNRNITELKETYNKLEESQKQLQALAEYLEKIREEERTYIAREIHDDLGQTLTALKIDLAWLTKNLGKSKGNIENKLNDMIKLVDRTIKTVQKISSQLRPGILDDLGFVAAIEWATSEFQQRTGIGCNLQINPEFFDLKENFSVALFRIYQEILTNISRHANAHNVKIVIAKNENSVKLFVKDDGKGIDKNKIDDPKSLGLLGIKERVRGLKGNLKIAGEQGKGTTIEIVLPLKGKAK